MFFFFLDKRYFYPQRLEFIISSFFNNAVVILFFYEKTNASKGYRGVGKNSNLYPGILNAEVFKFALVIFASTIPIASKCKSVSSKICVCKFSRFWFKLVMLFWNTEKQLFGHLDLAWWKAWGEKFVLFIWLLCKFSQVLMFESNIVLRANKIHIIEARQILELIFCWLVFVHYTIIKLAIMHCKTSCIIIIRQFFE